MESKTKKIVTEKWIKAFPELRAYVQNKLYKIVGPFVCGIELINLPRSENYRPHFVIYSIWKGSVKSSLEYPVLMQEFYNHKNLQLNLSYEEIGGKLNEAQSIVSSSLKISFVKDITLDEFYRLIDDALHNDITYKSHSGKIASLYELKFYASLYIGNHVKVDEVLNLIRKVSQNWNMKTFDIWFGKFDTWLKGLEEKAKCREEFLLQIETNKLDKKIAQLKSSELIA